MLEKFVTKSGVAKEMELPIQQVLAVVFAAFRINGGYHKDTFRFSEETNKTKFSNKDLVKFYFNPEWRPNDYENIDITNEDYENVDHCLKFFKTYTMKVLGNELTDFQKQIYKLICAESVTNSDLGRLAYVPQMVIAEKQYNEFKKLLRTDFRNSEHLGTKGQKVKGVAKVLYTKYSRDYEGYTINADYMGNIISFFKKENIMPGTRIEFQGLVKDKRTNFVFPVKETKLNYFKFKEVRA